MQWNQIGNIIWTVIGNTKIIMTFNLVICPILRQKVDAALIINAMSIYNNGDKYQDRKKRLNK